MRTELAAREDGGVLVALYWEAGTNDVFVRVTDTRSGNWFSVAVDAASALDAYKHPFAYAFMEGSTFIPSDPWARTRT